VFLVVLEILLCWEILRKLECVRCSAGCAGSDMWQRLCYPLCPLLGIAIKRNNAHMKESLLLDSMVILLND
jgi:hypothetical protein